MAIQSINPATGELLQTFKASSHDEVSLLLSKAETAFNEWKKLTVAQRLVYIKKIAEILDGDKEILAKAISLEMGRILPDSVAEVGKCADICRFYVENAEKFLADQHVDTGASKSYIEFAPLGLVLGIMPWNFPFSQAFRAMIPALAAGNVFIMKPASNVPQCALAIESTLVKAGLPEGVFTNIFMSGTEMTKIIADPRIAAVSLTGSEAAGSIVAKTAGEHLKKSVLELGGSDAFIVLEDADIDNAVANAVKGRLVNSGQACNSPKRIILTRKIAERFKKSFLEISKKLKVGDPFDPSVNVGPLARPDLVDEVDRQVKDSLIQGAKLLQGGKRIEGAGNFYEVTVVDDVVKGMPLFDEEVFGPVVAFITVSNDEEAISVANDTHLGLSASIWTKDIKRAHYFIDNLHVGLVFVNQLVRSDPRMPFGGVKKSGYGRELGEHGIREFTNIKTIVIK